MVSGSATRLFLAQNFRGKAVQRLPAALEQAVIGRVLDQRVLEAIVGLGAARPRQTGGLPRRAVPTTPAEPPRRFRRRRAAADRRTRVKNRPDLRDLARGAEPIEARRERLLQGGRDGLNAAPLPPLQEQARHLLDEQRHATCPFADPLDHLLGERMTRPRSRRPCERPQRDRAERERSSCDASAGSRTGETQDGS